MGKFKVGDRIELVEDYGGYDVGTKATVTSLWGEGVNAETDDGGYFGCYYSRVKLVPTFRVGDRVRMVKEVDGYKSDKTATVIHDDGTDSIPLAIEFAEPFEEGHSAGRTGKYGYCFWVSPDDIEHVPLTIEAGKFYMTRDGRRVGPMQTFGENNFIKKLGDGFVYGADGKRLYEDTPNEDIVALAPDEAPAYTANAAAEVDNQADDYGGGKKAPKFKVGDRVRNKSVPEAGVGVVEAIKPEGGYRVNYKDTWYGVCHDTDNDMVIVTPAHSHAIVAVIEDGQPKPATRPYVHADRAAAKAEAERLAGLNNGKTFGVYELVDEAKVEAEINIGDMVELKFAARVTGLDKRNANILLQGGGSFVLPISELEAA